MRATALQIVKPVPKQVKYKPVQSKELPTKSVISNRPSSVIPTVQRTQASVDLSNSNTRYIQLNSRSNWYKGPIDPNGIVFDASDRNVCFS